MGIEKLIPRAKDLGVFLRLLARSATGQPITTYSSHFHGPRAWWRTAHRAGRQRTQWGAGPAGIPPLTKLHPLWSVHEYVPGVPSQRRAQLWHDNPRSDRFDSGPGTRSPANIRHCRTPAACADLVRMSARSKLTCTTSCWHGARNWRNRKSSPAQCAAMKITSQVLRHTWLYRLTGKVARVSLAWLPRWLVYNRFNAWGRQRDLPAAPSHSFRALYAREKRDK